VTLDNLVTLCVNANSFRSFFDLSPQSSTPRTLGPGVPVVRGCHAAYNPNSTRDFAG
jgi:hypothetical protein